MSFAAGPSCAAIVAGDARERVAAREVDLVEHDEIGAGKLILEDLLERVVVVERGIGGALSRKPRKIGRRSGPARDRAPIDDGDDAVDRDARADYRAS